MSYADAVAPDARTDFRNLEIETQEAVLDLMDEIAKEGPTLAAGVQDHELWVVVGGNRTRVFLRLEVDHTLRRIQLILIGRIGPRW
jgi:hypothetical protein